MKSTPAADTKCY